LEQAERNRLNKQAGIASVGVAAVLVFVKLWAFAATGSLSIAAAAADSALDLLVSFTAFMAILYAARPPDADHAFGHSSAEDLAALGQATAILVSGLAIGLAAVQRLIGGAARSLSAEGLGLVVMGSSVALTIVLVLFQRRVARRTDNRIVAADSLHYLGDLTPNLGAIVSLLAARYFGIVIIDTLVALAASAMMIFGAVRIGKKAIDALMDRKAPNAVEQDIGHIARSHPGVRDYHDLRTRMAGSRIFVVLHIELDGDQTLRDAHEIGAQLRSRILTAYPNADVTIHKDVWLPDLAASR
jgi:ferrous-iron efflux pump FieF